jgi:hypothetical protein
MEFSRSGSLDNSNFYYCWVLDTAWYSWWQVYYQDWGNSSWYSTTEDRYFIINMVSVLSYPNIIIDTSWVSNTQSWLTIWSDYYLSNTPWAISTTPWTNIVSVWKAVSSTWIDINSNDRYNNNTYSVTTDTIVFTRDTSAASWTVNYTHWLWKIPKQIIFEVLRPATWGVWECFWSYSLTTNANKCVYLPSDTWNAWTNTTYSIIYSNAAQSAGQFWAVSATSTSNFTINWTKSWSPTGTFNIVAHLIA